MVALNLIILRKDNIVCAVLVNAAVCLNLIWESKVQHLRNYTTVVPFMNSSGNLAEERNIILTVEISSSLCTSSWQFLWPPNVHHQAQENCLKVRLL